MVPTMTVLSDNFEESSKNPQAIEAVALYENHSFSRYITIMQAFNLDLEATVANNNGLVPSKRHSVTRCQLVF